MTTRQEIVGGAKSAARRALLSASAAAAVLGLTAIGSGANAQTYEWKLTTYVPVGSGTWNSYMQPFVDMASDLTGGKVKIKGFSVGVLSSPFDAWKVVQKGNADMCFCFPAFAANADPVNAILSGIAGGMSPDMFMHWALAGEGGDLWRKFKRETAGLHPLITGFGPAEIFLHSHKKVQNLSDLKGMKIRTTGAWASILKSLGASPTVMAPSAIYTSLERKVIDGTEFVTPSTNIKLGYHKIARFIIVPGIHQPTHANEVVMRADAWDKLPKEIRKRVALAARVAGMESYLKVGMADLAAVEKLKKGRNTWVTLDPGVYKQVNKLARKWTADQAKAQKAKGNPWMERVSNSYWGFYDRFEKYGVNRVK